MKPGGLWRMGLDCNRAARRALQTLLSELYFETVAARLEGVTIPPNVLARADKVIK